MLKKENTSSKLRYLLEHNVLIKIRLEKKLLLRFNLGSPFIDLFWN